jgi:NOL1/NOP2/fmu family ribosome biogenesis protein
VSQTDDDGVELSIEELLAVVVNAAGGSIRLTREEFDKELAGDMLAVDFDETTEEVVIALENREDIDFDN